MKMIVRNPKEIKVNIALKGHTVATFANELGLSHTFFWKILKKRIVM